MTNYITSHPQIAHKLIEEGARTELKTYCKYKVYLQMD